MKYNLDKLGPISWRKQLQQDMLDNLNSLEDLTDDEAAYRQAQANLWAEKDGRRRESW